ncbi:MAG TPA: 3-hydroxyacyl-ACP dehydratase FabZ family protein [Pseudolabrys sp.]|jgi:3-hydroxyacyl-[acyl-carrier-protein] dehydratase|nr:3-hydroxyacyl-ACP dehydratase FabZ family protein [Pseudolabrys sp.]
MKLEKFQLIDRVVDFNEADKSIRCEAKVPLESSIFEGHFPGYPLMPGVLLLETMAQTSGWAILMLLKFQRMPFLAAAREAKFRGFVLPGAALDMHAKIVHDGSGFAVAKAEGKLDGKVVCDATIMFRVVEFPNEEIRGSMLELARRNGVPAEMIQ